MQWQHCWKMTRSLTLLVAFLVLPAYISAEYIPQLVPSGTATVTQSSAIYFSADGLGYPVMTGDFPQGW